MWAIAIWPGTGVNVICEFDAVIVKGGRNSIP